MIEITVEIKKRGGCLNLPIPAAIARAARRRANQIVRVSADAGHLVISPISIDELSLEHMLALYDPIRHGGESMVTNPIGSERL